MNKSNPQGGSTGIINLAMFNFVMGWIDQSELQSAQRRHMQALHELLALPSNTLYAAMRAWLTAAALPPTLALGTWLQIKTLFLARRFLDDSSIQREALEHLSSATELSPRRAWLDAFGLPPLARYRRLVAPAGKRGSAVRQRAEKNGLSALDVEELLVLRAPPNVSDGWETPFAWFVQNTSHMAEAHTIESIAALAAYLARRQAELHQRCEGGGGSSSAPPPPIVEVGSGSGRLAFLLNERLSGRAHVVATDLDPRPDLGLGDAAAMLSGQVERLDHATAIRRYEPYIVLCAWMSLGQDWTPAWRDLGVQEYVLIGELAEAGTADERCYSLNRQAHGEYGRVVLEEVSQSMLSIHDARDVGRTEQRTSLVAVSFRRKGLAPVHL